MPPMTKKFSSAVVMFLAAIGLLSLVSCLLITALVRPWARVAPALRDAQKPIARQAGAQEMYLELLKRVLTRYGFENGYEPVGKPPDSLHRWAYSSANSILAIRGKRIAEFNPPLFKDREEGKGWPAEAETMVGLKRLDNIQRAVTDVIHEKVPGDLIECGAWRGGSCIFMRAVLAVYGVKDKTVWVSDSFEGLPKPAEGSYPEEHLWNGGEMAVSLEEVQDNFRKYGLLDDQVRFLKGYFKDTLPKAPIEHLAILRVDGDLYESVTETLEYMYPKVSAGGYIILDDYGDHLPPARKAVDDYRKAHGITTPIERIDYSGAFWRKTPNESKQ